MIRILHREPGQKPPIKQVVDELHSIVPLVGGGYIEAVPITDDGLCLFCDEDGARKNLPYNFRLGQHQVLGSAIIVRRNDPDLADLTGDDVARIMEWIERP